MGGYCYLNNAAIAAQHCVAQGAARVAVLDVDFHHGNGTQDIFYDRADVLFASIHGEPRVSYPYFSGYADERGIGAGEGFNLNLPLPKGTLGTPTRRRSITWPPRSPRMRPTRSSCRSASIPSSTTRSAISGCVRPTTCASARRCAPGRADAVRDGRRLHGRRDRHQRGQRAAGIRRARVTRGAAAVPPTGMRPAVRDALHH